MIENLSMVRKGLCLITIPMLFQLLFIAALFRSQADGREAQAWAIHSNEVIAQAEAASRYLVQAQSSVRGLVVTGHRSFFEDFETATRLARAGLKKLRGLVADNPSQRAKVDTINERAEDLTGWLAGTANLVLSGHVDRAADGIKALGGRKSYEDFRDLISAFLREEEGLNRKRRDDLRRDWRRQTWFLAGAAVVTVAGAGSLLIAFSQTFARRIEILVENARRIAEGRPLAEPIRGQDEIGRLDVVFHRMARTLAEREQENEMFIYSVSHDLRSPLVNLQGFGKELAYACDDLERFLGELELPEADRRRLADILDSDIKNSIHFITVAVGRLSGIIDALLRLSRAGRVEYRRQAIDIEAALRRVVDSLRGSAAEKGAVIDVEPLPPAWGDPTAIEQIFANLLGNAVNYLDPQRPGRISVGALDEASGADGSPRFRTYFVRDNGLGIPEAHQPKLFLAFQRLHPEAAKGEGIGLAVVRRVIERLGGRIWVESEPGRGSTFFITLPADAESGVSPDERARPVYGQKEQHHDP
jgi:signal transduction histidine kinase